MSNKQLKRTEAEFFVYEPGVVVPRDVTHLLVPAGVEVLPNDVFRGLAHLKELVLPEGLREIGERALKDCRSLERIEFPFTLIWIGDDAFSCCTSLTALNFPEGLFAIGDSAFDGCSSLKRISLSSTITTIGSSAFYGCSSLKVVVLIDGILTIGQYAFARCVLEEILLPTTLTQIRLYAFGSCRSLRTVKLSGGIQLITCNAFKSCTLLDHVSVTSKCLVVTRVGNDYNFSFPRDGSIAPTCHNRIVVSPPSEIHQEFDQVLITSECFYSMSAAEVSALEVVVAEILRTQIVWSDKHERLRTLLAPHERRRKEEVTTILELGLWKAEMLRSGVRGPGNRAACRVTCKAGGIIPNVVSFL